MRPFEKRLNEAMELIPLTKIDKRLDQNSECEPIRSNLKRSQQFHSTCGGGTTPAVHTSLKNIREDLEAQPSVLTPEQSQVQRQGQIPQEPQLPQGDEITSSDLPPLQSDAQGGQPPAAPQPGGEGGGEQGGGMSNGGGYNTKMAKDQLDGILKNWLDLAGEYPEGDMRHNFLEIGERMREISAVLHRDFLGGEESSPSVRPVSGMQSPVAGPGAGLSSQAPAPEQGLAPEGM